MARKKWTPKTVKLDKKTQTALDKLCDGRSWEEHRDLIIAVQMKCREIRKSENGGAGPISELAANFKMMDAVCYKNNGTIINGTVTALNPRSLSLVTEEGVRHKAPYNKVALVS